MANHIIITKLENGNVRVDNSLTNVRSLQPNLEVIKEKDGETVSVLKYYDTLVYKWKYQDVEKVVRADGTEVAINDQDTLYSELEEYFFFLNVASGGGGTGNGWDGVVSTRNDLPITIGSPAIGSVYLAENPVWYQVLGVNIYKTYQSGLYIRDFDNGDLNDWRRLNVKTEFTENQFRIVQSSDNAIKTSFNTSGLTASRQLTIQDKDGTIAYLSDVQSSGAIATTINSWTLDTGTTYYADIVHGLGTEDLHIETYDFNTKETVIVQDIVRTDANTIRIYVEGNTEVIRVLIWDVVAIVNNTNNFNVVTNPSTPYIPQNNDLILWDCTVENKTINLPNPLTSLGLRFDVQKTDISTNKILINPFNTELIAYTTGAEVTFRGDSFTIVCDGVNWYII